MHGLSHFLMQLPHVRALERENVPRLFFDNFVQGEQSDKIIKLGGTLLKLSAYLGHNTLAAVNFRT
jgi:hypothetical protein